MDKYELTLIKSGDRFPHLQSAFNYVQDQFPLVKDSGASLIDHKEYESLIKDKKIASARSWWGIEKEQKGIVIKSYYQTYTKTWQLVFSSMKDFREGCKHIEKRRK